MEQQARLGTVEGEIAEIIFATYESARRRGRVDLPLDIEDSPLTALVEQGAYPDAGKTGLLDASGAAPSAHLRGA